MTSKPWTGAALKQFQRDYSDRDALQMADLMAKYGRTEVAIRTLASRHGWSRDKEWCRERNRRGGFVTRERQAGIFRHQHHDAGE